MEQATYEEHKEEIRFMAERIAEAAAGLHKIRHLSALS